MRIARTPMSKVWANTNECPYCGTFFVVTSMLHYHLEHNQCGVVPADWAKRKR